MGNFSMGHQDLIGRIDSLAGKWSIKWRNAQRKYGIKSGNKQYSGRKWAATFNSQIRLYGKTIWKQRSAKVHEHDYAESQAKLAEVLAIQIENEFNTGTDGLRAVDRHLVTNTDAKSLKKRKLPDQQRWLKHIDTARKRFIKVSSQDLENMRSNMATWLDPSTPSISKMDA